MKSTCQKWYVANLIIELGASGEKERRPLFDQQIRLLRAASHDEAYRKALKLGREENQSYRNPSGQTVKWKFVGLADLDLIRQDILVDGIEVYSSLQRGEPRRKVRTKEELEIFWYEANKRRPVGELTTPSRVRYVPALALTRAARTTRRKRGSRQPKTKTLDFGHKTLD